MAVSIPRPLIDSLKKAKRVVVLTGAGISAESGVPTFREAQTGLWAQYDPQELATPQAFQRNPKLVWEWYAWRRDLVAKAEPNAAHQALVALERRVPHFTLITQNVDGLHGRSGSKNIIELHGNISHTKCFANHHPVANWPPSQNIPPACPQCGSPLRPDVVWFGENLPYEALNQASQASQNCDIFLSIGTSALVQPAASLPLQARQHKAITVEINPSPTPISAHLQYILPGKAATILPLLVAQIL